MQLAINMAGNTIERNKSAPFEGNTTAIIWKRHDLFWAILPGAYSYIVTQSVHSEWKDRGSPQKKKTQTESGPLHET
jgi:hypothetical protein